jgi:hypothetical protein
MILAGGQTPCAFADADRLRPEIDNGGTGITCGSALGGSRFLLSK